MWGPVGSWTRFAAHSRSLKDGILHTNDGGLPQRTPQGLQRGLAANLPGCGDTAFRGWARPHLLVLAQPDWEQQDMNRRRFLISAGAVVVTAAAGLAALPEAIRWKRAALRTRHVAGSASASPFDNHKLSTLCVFLGALFGRELDETDRKELTGRLEFAVQHDSGWREEYDWLASHLDRMSRQAGYTSFVDADAPAREGIVAEIMGYSASSRRARLLALVSEDERRLRRMRRSTLNQLTWLYRHSGVPWRARGYTSWPGTPGSLYEYTKPGPVCRC
jgi:hypothetical protein